MSKHFRGVDGSLLKADKRWSDLSNKQKEKIAGWMREAFQKHYPDDEAVLDEVFQKIENCGIWIPDHEIIKRYNAKKPKYQKDYESKHNVNCWEQKEYLGFGLAAHSYFNKERYANTTDMKEYLEFKGLNCKITYEKQNDDDTKKEYMLLGLRKINGVSIQKFKNKFGENPIFLFKNELSKLVEQNLLIIDGDCIKLTNKGLDLANLVWEEFI